MSVVFSKTAEQYGKNMIFFVFLGRGNTKCSSVCQCSESGGPGAGWCNFVKYSTNIFQRWRRAAVQWLRASRTKPKFNFSFVFPVGPKTDFNCLACVHKRETYSRTKLMDIRDGSATAVATLAPGLKAMLGRLQLLRTPIFRGRGQRARESGVRGSRRGANGQPAG